MRSLVLLAVLAAGQAAPIVEEVWRAPAGTFIESIAVEPDDSLLMTNLYRGEILRRYPNGEIATAARLPGYVAGSPGFICLVRDVDGTVYATYLNGAEAGIFRITAAGSGAPLAILPAGASPNGLALDGRGGLIVADNGGGLWRVDTRNHKVVRWLDHPLLTRHPGGPGFPAANGVQRDGDRLLVANSDRGLLVEIALQADGSPGAVRQRAADVAGDDFAVTVDGTAYVATHPQNTIVAVARDGSRRLYATAAQGLYGPTTAVIISDRQRRWLLVANDGGAFARVPAAAQRPGLVRIALEPVSRLRGVLIESQAPRADK